MNCPKTLVCPKQPADSIIYFKNIPEKKICRRCEKGKDKNSPKNKVTEKGKYALLPM
jgi:hypothetical protein